MNEVVFLFFYNWAHRWEFLDQIIYFLGHYFPVLVILGAAGFLLWHTDVLPSRDPLQEFLNKWREIIAVFMGALTAWVLARTLKIIIEIERPFDALDSVNALISKSDFAFPSGHATFFSALATIIFFHHRRAGFCFLIFALIISLARVAAGVHFPIDILGGFILGVGIAYLLKKL